MPVLKECVIGHILYQKTGDEKITDRTIIPLHVPKNIKGLDVTALNDEEQLQMQQLVTEYRDYETMRRNSMFSFEAWCEHTGQTIPGGEPRWRTFKPENTTIL